MWKFLPFSFVIYCLEDIIISAIDGFMVIFITVAILMTPISCVQNILVGGFTNLRFITLSPPVLII
jgi:hypothetical protein